MGSSALSEQLDDPYAKVSYGQQGEDLILDRLFRRMLRRDPKTEMGFYIDAGAYHPKAHSTTALLHEHGWHGICIDMSPQSIALFREGRPNETIVQAAISDQPGEMTAFLSDDISLMNTVVKDAVPDYGNYSEQKVDVATLSGILDAERFEGTVDYLNIDIEGAELAALGGLDFDRHAPSIISIEIHASDVEEAVKSEVFRYLSDRGYRCVGCSVITYFFVLERAIPEAA